MSGPKTRRSDSLAAATNMAEVARFNNAVEDWAMSSVNKLQNNIRGYSIGHTGAMFNKLTHKLHFKDGEVERISYPMARYAILLQHGVGRGRGGEEPGRTLKPWFNDLWEKQRGLDDLADIVARMNADLRARAIADEVSTELKIKL
jgi:hypothetical protein